jgi:hypothetical protein
MLAYDYPLLGALWTVFMIFMFVIWFWLLIMIFSDLFRDHEESGWAKAGWTIGILLLPFLGILIYLIARGDGMARRSAEAQQSAQDDFDSYVRETAASDSPADQIASAQALLDAGSIDQDEFNQLKAKALS